MCASHVKRNGGDQDFHWWGHLIDDFHALGSGDLHGEDVVRDSDATVWRFALLFAKSDEDVRANDFGLAHFPAIDEVSSECLAFTETWVTATWRLGELMPFVVYRARAREPTHPLVESRFFCHRFLFPIDVMLLVGSKVVVPVAFGSVRMWLLADARLGSNRDNRLMVITSGNALRFMLRGPAPTFCGRSTWTTSRRTAEATWRGPLAKPRKRGGAAPFFSGSSWRIFAGRPIPGTACSMPWLSLWTNCTWCSTPRPSSRHLMLWLACASFAWTSGRRTRKCASSRAAPVSSPST